MWLGGIVAVEAPAQQNNSDSLIVLAAGVLVAAMVPLGSVLVEVVRGKNSRTTPSPPAPVPAPATEGAAKDVTLYERTARLSERFRQKDEADHAQDLVIQGHGQLLDQHGDTLEEHGRDIRQIKKHLGLNDA